MTNYWQLDMSFYKCNTLYCCPDGNCTADSATRCGAGRNGFLCGACAEPDHYSWGSSCVKCSETNGATLFLALCACHSR